MNGTVLKPGEEEAVAWRQWLKDAKGMADSSMLRYTRIMNLWLGWCMDRGIDPLRATEPDCAAFVARKHHQTGLARSAAIKELEAVVLRSYYKFLRRRKKMEDDPTEDLITPKVRKQFKPKIPEEHWMIFWNSADLSQRHRFQMAMLYFYGLRIDELLNLRNEQISPTIINLGHTKGNKPRQIPWVVMIEMLNARLPHLLPDPHSLYSLINSIRTDGREHPCPWTYPDAARRWLNKAYLNRGLPYYAPHDHRRSAVTNILDAGMSVQNAALVFGHDDINTTDGYNDNNAETIIRWWRAEKEGRN